MAEFLALFVFGSVGFWVTAITLSVLIILFDNRSLVFATVSTLSFVVLLEVSGIISIKDLGFVGLMVSILVYVVLGIIWSVIKWYSFLSFKRRDLDRLKLKFIQHINTKRSYDYGVSAFVLDEGDQLPTNISIPLPQRARHSFKRYLYNSGYVRSPAMRIVPTAGDYHTRLIEWMMFWPWSALWTLIDDPVRRLFTFVYMYLQDLYQSLSTRAFKNLADDEPQESDNKLLR